MKRHFVRYGIPKCIVSDSESQFTSDEFCVFCTKWAISHCMSSPGHQQSNGKAEAHVKIFKGMLQRTASGRQDQWLALLELRNTHQQDIQIAPPKYSLVMQRVL